MKEITKQYILKYAIVILCIYLAQFFLPDNLDSFPYRGALEERYSPPYVLASLANFDGVHYTNIAFEGYHTFDQAFFPLYPILIRSLGLFLNGNHLIAGIIISFVTTYIGIYFFYKLILDKYGIKKAKRAVVFLLAFPTAFFFQAVYSEGLFLAIIAASLYYLYKKNYLVAGLISLFASLARIQGVFMAIPFFVYFLGLRYYHNEGIVENFKRIPRLAYILCLMPFVGIVVYMVYLYQTTGDALFFLTSQPSFGANRSTSIILLPQVYFRYIKIFVTADFNFQYFVSVLELLFFTYTFVICSLVTYTAWRKRDFFELGLGLFSLTYIILPTLTGTFSSIPRYALLSLVQYIYLARIRKRMHMYALAVFFTLLQVILLSLFSRGFFIG